MNSQRGDELLARALDAALTPAEREELLELALRQPDFGRRLVELLRLEPLLIDQALTDSADEAFVRRVQQSVGPPGGERRFDLEQFTEGVVRRLAVGRTSESVRQNTGGLGSPSYVSRSRVLTAVTAVVLIAAVILLTRPGAAREIAELGAVTGEVVSVTGDRLRPVRAGTKLSVGDELRTVGEESAATVLFADTTRLELGGDTTIRLVSAGAAGQPAGRRVIFLADGLLTAEVVRRHADRPTVIATPHAEVIVKGTRFRLSSEPESMHIELQRGRVEVRRSSDGRSIELETGQSATIAVDRDSFAMQPLPPRQTDPAARLPRHAGQVVGLAFAPGKPLLVSADVGGTVRLHDLKEGTARDIPLAFQRTYSVTFSPDGRRLAVVGSRHGNGHAGSVPHEGKEPAEITVEVWDVESMEHVAGFPAAPFSLPVVSFSPDARCLAAVDAERNIRVWELADRQLLRSFRMRKGRILALGFSPDGDALQAVNEYGSVTVWDLPTGLVRSGAPLDPHHGGGRCAAFSADGRLFASGTARETVPVWDVSSGRRTTRLHGHLDKVLSLAFSADGRLLATGGKDRTARLWEAGSGRELLCLVGTAGNVRSLAFSPDGRLLAVGGDDGSLTLWATPVMVSAAAARSDFPP